MYRIIDALADLNRCPVGSIVLQHGKPWQRDERGRWRWANRELAPEQLLDGPLLLLWMPQPCVCTAAAHKPGSSLTPARPLAPALSRRTATPAAPRSRTGTCGVARAKTRGSRT